MIKKGERILILLIALLLILFCLNGVFAQANINYDYIITNSEDWRDVYSGLMYAGFVGVGSDFLVSTRHGPLLLNGLSRSSDIRVLSSRDKSYIINFPSQIRSEGFADADEVTLRNFNLELIESLPEINNFIVVGNTYGYDSIAVAPYARKTNSWVFFADRINIDEIDLILDNRNVDSIIVYGAVDREVRDTLLKYNPKVINNRDRFLDDIEITKEYLKISPINQVILTNGEFIEKDILSGSNPVLFTGKENVPDQIRDYIKNSEIDIGVLIGADLVGAATNIRRSTGISVIVKFARGARSPSSSIAQVEGLDLFYLPTPTMELSIASVKFNRATNSLEVTYRSNSSVPIYFKGTLTPIVDGVSGTRIGDSESVFIAPNDYKTVIYPGFNFEGGNLSLDVFTIYGESENSLEKVLQTRLEVEMVDVIDKCEIEIKGIKYNKLKKAFIVDVKNKASVDCYVDIELSDVIIDNNPEIIGTESSVLVNSGRSKDVIIFREMTDDDLKENSFVNVFAYFGERSDSLIKTFKGKFELDIEYISTYAIVLIITIILLVFIVFFLIFFKRRKKNREDY